MLYLLLVSARNVARQPAHNGLQMTSSLECQLVAQHPHYALAAPTMYLRQLIFCLHAPTHHELKNLTLPPCAGLGTPQMTVC